MAKKKKKKKKAKAARPAKKAKKKTPAPKPKPKKTEGAHAHLLKAETAMEDALAASSDMNMALLARMSDLTRKRTVLETENARISRLITGNETEAKDLEGELKELTAANKEAKGRRDKLASQEKSLGRENTALEKAIKKLGDSVSKFESKLSAGKKENAKLEKQMKRLSDDVERLTAIKAEYIERIAKFKAMREDLIK